MGGFSTYGWTYGQEALVATVKVEQEHDTAWQVYHENSSLALLPLWGGYSSIVWSLNSPKARQLLSLSSEEFTNALNQHFDQSTPPTILSKYDETISNHISPLSMVKNEILRITNTLLEVSQAVSGGYAAPPKVIETVSNRVSFPLQLLQTKSYVSSRIALVGDAAHSMHPHAGQGLNLGIADAKDLVETLINSLNQGQDIGSDIVLQTYDNSRRAHTLSALATVDVLHRIFQKESQLARYIRSLGMAGVHRTPMIKKQLIRFATGIHD